MTAVGYSPSSYYAECSEEEREICERIEAVHNHERHLETLERFGPHTEHWLRFKDDDSVRREAKRLTRQIEDIEDGDLPNPSGRGGRKNIHNRLSFLQARLRAVEAEQQFRQTLRDTWQASERGTHSMTGYHARGGLAAVLEHGAPPPSYPLAVLLDHANWLRGEPSVLQWDAPVEPRRAA